MTKICSVDGCERLHYAKGYCALHYRRFKVHGDPLLGALERKICTVDDCGKPAHGNGLCSWHYQRQRKGKPLDHPWKGERSDKKKGVAECSVDGCVNKVYRSGLCGGHYQRTRHGVVSDRPLSATTNGDTCSAPGCTRVTVRRGSGLCASHLRALEKREAKQMLIDKLGGKCAICGGVFPQEVYDFHHIDPSEKKLRAGSSTYSKAVQLEVLEKCELLCANCHRMVHIREALETHVDNK